MPQDQVFVETRTEYDENKAETRQAYAICAAVAAAVIALAIMIGAGWVTTATNNRQRAEAKIEACRTIQDESARTICLVVGRQ